MDHTFSKLPHLLFYEYFEQFDNVISENGDFAEKNIGILQGENWSKWPFIKVKIAQEGDLQINSLENEMFQEYNFTKKYIQSKFRF